MVLAKRAPCEGPRCTRWIQKGCPAGAPVPGSFTGGGAGCARPGSAENLGSTHLAGRALGPPLRTEHGSARTQPPGSDSASPSARGSL